MRLFSFKTSPAAPDAGDDDLSVLRLIRSRRVGPATFHRLVAEHGSARAALQALPDIARQAGVQDYAPCPEAVAVAELKAGHKVGARLIRCDSPDYPALLRDIPDAPPVIWLKGCADALRRPGLAVIGARNASSLGLRMARGMAGALAAQGITVIAGLARGIDTAAHEASLRSGTVAVMAGGIDVIYPQENRVLASMICDRGCLITEQPPGTVPVARHFPARNRIISGLAHGVVVVEAALKSGSLITARDALDQGREVMAVPGHPVDGRAGGCNQLIRNGAVLVRSAEDVIAALPDLQQSLARVAGAGDPPQGLTTGSDATPEAGVTQSRTNPETSARAAIYRHGPATPPDRTDTPSRATPAQIEATVLDRLSPAPLDEDVLIRDCGLGAAALAPVLLRLELSGKIARMAGGRVALSG